MILKTRIAVLSAAPAQRLLLAHRLLTAPGRMDGAPRNVPVVGAGQAEGRCELAVREKGMCGVARNDGLLIKP